MEEEIKLEVAKNVDTKDIELALQTDKKLMKLLWKNH